MCAQGRCVRGKRRGIIVKYSKARHPLLHYTLRYAVPATPPQTRLNPLLLPPHILHTSSTHPPHIPPHPPHILHTSSTHPPHTPHTSPRHPPHNLLTPYHILQTLTNLLQYDDRHLRHYDHPHDRRLIALYYSRHPRRPPPLSFARHHSRPLPSLHLPHPPSSAGEWAGCAEL